MSALPSARAARSVSETGEAFLVDLARTESLDDIMAAIARGCEAEGKREGESYWRVGDRAEAIQFAIDLARPGDLVITAGKGIVSHFRFFGTIRVTCPFGPT